MELVLDHRVEVARRFRQTVVVGGALGVDVGDLLPDTTFARPDRANPLQQFVKVVLAERIAAPLEPVVIQCKALDDVLAQHPRRPNAKMRRPHRVHPIPNSNNGVKIVKAKISRNLTITLVLNL